MHLRHGGARRPLRIGFMGTRGIPANYGGFETFYDNLATRLVARGYAVTVYNRPHGVKDSTSAPVRGCAAHPSPYPSGQSISTRSATRP